MKFLALFGTWNIIRRLMMMAVIIDGDYDENSQCH